MLSSKFIAESYNYKGEARKITMIEGYCTTKEPEPIPNKEKKQGTRITFFPCEEVLGEITLEWKSIYHLVKHIISMTPIGSVVDFEAVDSQNVSHKEKIVNTDGIITDLIMKVKFPLIKPIIISDICSFFAIALEPSTRKSAPFISSVKPININNICVNIFITCLNIFA